MCGPTEHPEFFQAIAEVFARYPQESEHYSIACLCLHKDYLDIDLKQQVGRTKVKEGRLVTEFVDRSSLTDDSTHIPCCQWVPEPGISYTCITYCDI